MSRSILVSFAMMLCFVMSAARSAAPPPRVYISLDSQLTLIDVQGGRYKLGGAANDRYVTELDLSKEQRWMGESRYKNIRLFDRLIHLNLSATWLKDADIEHVVRIRTLRSLDLSENEHITDKSARLLATLPHLETLDLKQASVGFDGIAQLGKLQNLKRLKCNGIHDGALIALARYRKLEHLDFGYAKLSEKGARAFALMPQLKELWMGSAELTPKAQPHLRHLTGLKVLNAHSVRLTDAGFEAITSLPALEVFVFAVYDDVPLSRAAISKIGNMKALKWVKGGTDDHFLEAVSGCKTVETINVFQCDNVTDAGVAHLVRCPSLRELDLGDTKVTDACIPSLIKIKSLRKVMLFDTGFTKAGIDRLRKARPDLRTMNSFDDTVDDPR